jgi:hypothetical protein
LGDGAPFPSGLLGRGGRMDEFLMTGIDGCLYFIYFISINEGDVMESAEKRTHTTLNLSSRLIKEASKLFREKSKTEIIHEALERMIQAEKLERHLKQWKGKGAFHSYE